MGVLNSAVHRMVAAALWASPLGVASLIAASILRACNLGGERGGEVARLPCGRAPHVLCLRACGHLLPGRAPTLSPCPPPTPWPATPHTRAGTLAALGLWAATVLAGLAIFAFAVLPALLWAGTGLSPLATARAFADSLLIAFGTSSSAAALPLAMAAAKERAGCEGATVDFFLPLGTTVNMNGTALCESRLK